MESFTTARRSFGRSTCTAVFTIVTTIDIDLRVTSTRRLSNRTLWLTADSGADPSILGALALGFGLVDVLASGVTKHAIMPLLERLFALGPSSGDFAIKDGTLFEDLDGQLTLIFEPPRWLLPHHVLGSGASRGCCLKLALVTCERSLRKEEGSENDREEGNKGATHAMN